MSCLPRRLLPLLAALMMSAVRGSSAEPARELPLPLGQLRCKPAPPAYLARHCSGSLQIDGHLDEPCWAGSAWTADFVSIVGATGPRPWLRTRAKMLWTDDALLVAAELEEPRAFAQRTKHDSIIFQDNDFELFLDPDADNEAYLELEVNAAGQVWDLLLPRPYRAGGPPLNSFETIQPAVPTEHAGPTGWSPSQVAVQVQGCLNCAEGSQGWTVELALPWSLLRQLSGRRPAPPMPGDTWRINFSRVHWNVTWDVQQGRYVKEPAEQAGYNWVWAPQWQVQMHQPETWGFLQFSADDAAQPAAAAAGAGSGEPWQQQPSCAPGALAADPTWPARALLMDVYHYQTVCWQERGRFCTSLAELGLHDLTPELAAATSIETTALSFLASTTLQLQGGERVAVAVDQTSRLLQFRPGELNPLDSSGQWWPGQQWQVQV